MDGRGYTWFGEVLYRILKEHGSSQSAFAREAQALGYDYRQNSISNWMRGVHAAPRDLPTLLEHLYDLDDQERMELALAFAYGQSLPKVDLEDIRARVGRPNQRSVAWSLDRRLGCLLVGGAAPGNPRHHAEPARPQAGCRTPKLFLDPRCSRAVRQAVWRTSRNMICVSNLPSAKRPDR